MYSNIKERTKRLRSGSVALLFLAAYSVSIFTPFFATQSAQASTNEGNSQGGPQGQHLILKDWVCKYVGAPGVDEHLKSGNDGLVWVSTNATQGSWFNDAHGRSYVLLANAPHNPQPNSSQCPAPQGPQEVMIPAVPSVNDPCGVNNAMWNVPSDTSALDWSINNGKLSVTTKTGYVFYDSTTYHYYGYAQDSDVQCLVPVQATAPIVASDSCGTQNDTFTIPSKTGVKYYIGANSVNAGTYSTNGVLQVTIIAQANQGYVLNGQSSWTLTFTNIACIIPVEPAAPVKSDSCGTKNDTFTIPDVQGVRYYVKDGYHYKPIAPGTYPADGMMVEIKAEAKMGYRLVGDDDHWKLYFSNELCKVTAVDPTKSDSCGTKNDTFTIPTVEGVRYYVKDGYHYKPIAPGVYPAESWKIEIKAVAMDGYKLIGDDHWTLIFNTKPCLIVVVPQTPTQIPVCGAGNDEVDIPEIQGVIYKTFWKGGTLIVKAEPAPGYVFPQDSEDEEYGFTQQYSRHDSHEHHDWEWVWRFVDENTPCPVEVTVPVDPTVVCGADNDIITVPSNTSHVTYTSTGWVNGKNTVTATADPGYYIEGTQGLTTQSWTYTDTNTSCGQVLGDSTTTPQVLGASTTVLENTGTSLTLPILLSTGVLGIAIMTLLQSDKRSSRIAKRLRAISDKLGVALNQPFVLPTV